MNSRESEDSNDYEEKLASINRRSQDLERSKNIYKLEASRLKDECDGLRLDLLDLQAQLTESQEELQLNDEVEQEKDFFKKENFRLQQQLSILSERLRRTEDRAEYSLEEKLSFWDTYDDQAKMLQESVQFELKKIKHLHEQMVKDNTALLTMNDKLSAKVILRDQQLAEYHQKLEQAQRSFSFRRKALADHLSALEKVNAKLKETLALRNGQR